MGIWGVIVPDEQEKCKENVSRMERSKAPTIYYTILYIYGYSIYIYSICIDQLRGFAYTVYIWFIWFIH